MAQGKLRVRQVEAFPAIGASMSDTDQTAAVPGDTETHPESAATTAGAAPDASDGSGAAASGDEPTDREAAVQRLGVATDAALSEMGYVRLSAGGGTDGTVPGTPASGSGWPSYVSHKVVQALPITEITPATADTP